MGIDLPLIWAIIIGFGLMMYVIMDGFDLGIGILFPFVHDRHDRDTMVNTVAPVWDGNETWLVLGGAAFGGTFYRLHLLTGAITTVNSYSTTESSGRSPLAGPTQASDGFLRHHVHRWRRRCRRDLSARPASGAVTTIHSFQDADGDGNRMPR